MRIRPLAGEDFERVERELHERFVEAEREVLGELLERLDVDAPSVALGGPPIPSGASQHRELYDGGGAGDGRAHAVPVRARTRGWSRWSFAQGLSRGTGTALAARQASCVVARMTPSEGEALLRELGNMGAVEELARPLAQGGSVRAGEANREGFESTLREAMVVPEEAVTVAVSLDGVMVPMKDGRRAEKRERSRATGRRAKGPAGLSGGGLRDAVVLRRRRRAARYAVPSHACPRRRRRR